MNFDFKKAYPHVIAIAIFVLISIIYFAPQLKGYKLYQSDHEQYIGMSQEIRNYNEKFDDETLWTNSTFGGMPTYQISAISGNLINKLKNYILKALPRPAGYIFLLMTGFYIMLLCFGVDPRLAVIGAIAYGLASFNMLYLGNGHNAKVHAISFLPPIVGGIVYAYRKNIWVGSILVSLFTCLHLSANHLQMTYYFLYLLLALVIMEIYVFARNGALPKFFKVSAFLLLAGLLGLAPTLTNIIVTNEYSKHTTRGKSELTAAATGAEQASGEEKSENALDPEYIKRYNFSKAETWSLVIPNIKGGKMGALGQNRELMKKVEPRYRQAVAQQRSYWGEQYTTGGTFYFGAAMFLLFVLGMFFVKDKIKWSLLAVTVLAVMLSWKYGNLIDFFIDKVPFFSKFRDSKMMLILLQLAFPLMGILFLKTLFTESIEKKKFLYITFSVSGLIFLFYLMPTVWFDFLSRMESEQINAQIVQNQNNPAIVSQIEDIRQAIINIRIEIFKKDVLRSLFFVIITGVLVYLILTKKMKKQVFIVLLGIFVLIDMWGVAKRYLNNEKKGSKYVQWVDEYEYNNPFKPTIADMAILRNEIKKNPDLNSVIQEEVAGLKNKQKTKPKEFEMEKIKVFFRELNFGTNYRVLSLTSPLTMSSRDCYFHKTLVGYHGAKLRRFDELIGSWISREYSYLSQVLKNIPETDSIISLPVNNIPVLSMLNTKYIIYDPNKLPVLNPYRFGNTWFVRKVEFVENADGEMMALGTIDKAKAVIQEKFKDKINSEILYDSTGIIELTQYRPNHLIYKSNAANDQVAIFSEIYYEDGWDAYIDGEKADYVKANFYGLKFSYSSFNNISENNIENCREQAISIFDSCKNNSITANNIKNNRGGIWFEYPTRYTDEYYSNYNKIIRNNIDSNTDWGILLQPTVQNIFSENNITNNGKGVRLNAHGNSNEFYLNNFKNNTLDIEQWGNATNWDNGTIGNYWDNYNGIDNNGDGIGDTPYIINDNNQDNYPLMNPVIIPEFPSWAILQLILTITMFIIVIRKQLHKAKVS